MPEVNQVALHRVQDGVVPRSNVGGREQRGQQVHALAQLALAQRLIIPAPQRRLQRMYECFLVHWLSRFQNSFTHPRTRREPPASVGGEPASAGSKIDFLKNTFAGLQPAQPSLWRFS